jgi:hypothetical protein
VHELLKDFLKNLFQLLYELWTAPADKAFDLLATLATQLLILFIAYITLRWMWRKVCGK